MIACASTTPVSVPRPRSARRAAPTRKTDRPAVGPYSAAATSPIPSCYPTFFSIPKSATAMSSLLQKNLIYIHYLHNNLNFLVDSGASISILSHSSSVPPTGPHLVGANGKPIPAWGVRRRTVCFAGHNFEFDFTGGNCHPYPRHGFPSKI
jgi:hypothetical protein